MYYKFTFVRNPYDLLVSLYFYIKQSKNHKYHKKVKMLNFSEFLKWHISRGPLLQIDFIRDFNQETILVDRIGRFENLNQDIIKIKESIGLNCSKTELKHKNPSIIR